MPDAIEAAARWEWMCGILDGERCSDFAESFPEIRQLLDLVDENKRFKAESDQILNDAIANIDLKAKRAERYKTALESLLNVDSYEDRKRIIYEAISESV
jgi:hypothetical protein